MVVASAIDCTYLRLYVFVVAKREKNGKKDKNHHMYVH